MAEETQDQSDEAPTAPGPLSHLRVLDMSRVLAGPWTGQLLGDMGADVIKVERPGHGDDTRVWGPPFIENADGSSGDGSYYTAANRNKRSIIVDLAKPLGADLVRRLADKSDIVVENFKLGGLAKYGLDYESVAATNPSVIYCSITGFGQDGPYAPRPGYDYIIQGMSGILSITGRPDEKPGGGPIRVGIAVSDLFGGMYATTAILSAIVHRERTGQGQYIDCSLLEAQIAALANQGASYLTTGFVPQRTGNSHPALAPYRIYRASDGHIILAVGNDDQFARACDVLGLSAMKDDPKFKKAKARVANRDELDAAIDAAFLKWKRDDAILALEKVKVPCGPILALDEVFANPQIVSRDMVRKPKRADGTEVPVSRYPVKLSATPASVRRAPPAHGADTDDVLANDLGLSEDEIAALRREGIVGNPV